MSNSSGNKEILTKILAITGTILLWIPLLFTILTGIIGTISARVLRCDYLIPAELFPLVFFGVLLLLWAAIRAHLKQRIFGGGLLLAILFLFGGQTVAALNGLASGEIEPAGWPWITVLTCITLYNFTIIIIGISGIALIRKLFHYQKK